MFDEVFTKWINTGQLSLEDITIILLEYNQVFGDGKVTGDQIIQMIQQDPRVKMCDFVGGICKALNLLGVYKKKQWITVITADGQIIRRFFNEQIKTKVSTDSSGRDESNEG